MPLDGLDKLVAKGQRLLDGQEPVQTHSEFNRWVSEVSRWLNSKFPDSGLSADWAAQGDSNLVMGSGYHNDPSSWSIFRMKVQGRLRWLGELLSKLQISNLSAPAQVQNTSSLHPWGVISSSMFELSSDEVVEIMSSTGLQIDWSLSTNESYSHTTRKRAYIPRANSAFSKLSNGDKLRVVQVVATELIQRHPNLEPTLRNRLNTIGWAIDSGAIVPSSREVAELFFPRGSEHDAYVELKKIIQSAQRSIIIVDPYLDSSILTLLGTCNNSLEIRLISYKLPNDFTLEVANFRKQHSSHTLEIRLTREFHDRFIVIDDVNCFHVGASIKDAGDRAFMINQVQDKANVCAIVEQVGKSWDGAKSEQN